MTEKEKAAVLAELAKLKNEEELQKEKMDYVNGLLRLGYTEDQINAAFRAAKAIEPDVCEWSVKGVMNITALTVAIIATYLSVPLGAALLAMHFTSHLADSGPIAGAAFGVGLILWSAFLGFVDVESIHS